MLTKRDFSILLGNTLDHFDTALYGFLAPVLGPVFFPNYDPVVQLILTYSLLLTSIVARPLGVLIFGLIARARNPLYGLSISLTGVALSTFSMGFLPGFAKVGWLSPLSLMLLRFTRGVFAAGETTIAKMYIMEGKTDEQALKASYLYQSSNVLGYVIASFFATLSFSDTTSSEFWRVCFWLGGITGLVGLYLRNYVLKQEKLVLTYDKIRVFDRSIVKAFAAHRYNIIRIALATSFSYVTYAFPFIFMNGFVPLVSGITLRSMMAYNTLLLVLDMVLIPVVGWYTIKYSSIKVMTISSLILALTIVPLFASLEHASLGYVTCIRIWIVFWGVVYLCPLNFWMKKMFNTNDQYLLVGIGTELGASCIGRLTSSFCLWLWYSTSLVIAPAFYLLIVAILTSIVITSKFSQPYEWSRT